MKRSLKVTLQDLLNWLSDLEYAGAGARIEGSRLAWVNYASMGMAGKEERQAYWRSQLEPFEGDEDHRVTLERNKVGKKSKALGDRASAGHEERTFIWLGQGGDHETSSDAPRTHNQEQLATLRSIIQQEIRASLRELATPQASTVQLTPIERASAEGLILNLLDKYDQRVTRQEVTLSTIVDNTLGINQQLYQSNVQLMLSQSGVEPGAIEQIMGTLQNNSRPLMAAFRALRSDPDSPEGLKRAAQLGQAGVTLLSAYNQSKNEDQETETTY